MKKNIQIKRVYEPAEREDGVRVLVDRLWPRGLTKEKAKIDLWLKEIAPSTQLRKWFGHDHAKWEEFKKRYTAELDSKQELTKEIKEHAKHGKVTLVYGARDEEFNEAKVLSELLK